MSVPVRFTAPASLTTPPSAATPDIAQQFSALVATSEAWLRAHTLDIAIASGAAVLIYLVFRAARRLVRGAAIKHSDPASFGAMTLNVLSRTGQFFMIAAAVRVAIGLAHPPQWVLDFVGLAFTIAAAIQVAIWLRAVIMGVLRRRAADGQSETLANALALINVLVSIALFSIAGIVVLDNLGVNVTALIAGLGIGGIAIGLAAKGIFEDLFAALAIIFDRPFRKGETIGFEGRTAMVERIGLKSTRLRALTGEEVIISNTNLLSKEVLNYAEVPKRRLKLLFGVASTTPPATLRAIPDMLRDIVHAQGCTPEHVGITAFAPSGIDHELHYDDAAATFAETFANRHAIHLAIVERFMAEGISLSSPTQVAYTAAPDGTLIYPWPSDEAAAATSR
jgi:small-conductance mechanosensitive channel